MQIRAVSELDNLGVVYKSALQMPDSLNNKCAYIEVSYKNADGISYDSMKIDLSALLECLYRSINQLCSEVTTLRNKVNADNIALSAGTGSPIYGYNTRIDDLIRNNNNAHHQLSAGTGDPIKGYNTRITQLENNIGANYLNKNDATNIQEIKGPIVFSNTSNISGTILNALTANCAKWN